MAALKHVAATRETPKAELMQAIDRGTARLISQLSAEAIPALLELRLRVAQQTSDALSESLERQTMALLPSFSEEQLQALVAALAYPSASSVWQPSSSLLEALQQRLLRKFPPLLQPADISGLVTMLADSQVPLIPLLAGILEKRFREVPEGFSTPQLAAFLSGLGRLGASLSEGTLKAVDSLLAARIDEVQLSFAIACLTLILSFDAPPLRSKSAGVLLERLPALIPNASLQDLLALLNLLSLYPKRRSAFDPRPLLEMVESRLLQDSEALSVPSTLAAMSGFTRLNYAPSPVLWEPIQSQLLSLPPAEWPHGHIVSFFSLLPSCPQLASPELLEALAKLFTTRLAALHHSSVLVFYGLSASGYDLSKLPRAELEAHFTPLVPSLSPKLLSLLFSAAASPQLSWSPSFFPAILLAFESALPVCNAADVSFFLHACKSRWVALSPTLSCLLRARVEQLIPTTDPDSLGRIIQGLHKYAPIGSGAMGRLAKHAAAISSRATDEFLWQALDYLTLGTTAYRPDRATVDCFVTLLLERPSVFSSSLAASRFLRVLKKLHKYAPVADRHLDAALHAMLRRNQCLDEAMWAYLLKLLPSFPRWTSSPLFLQLARAQLARPIKALELINTLRALDLVPKSLHAEALLSDALVAVEATPFSRKNILRLSQHIPVSPTFARSPLLRDAFLQHLHKLLQSEEREREREGSGKEEREEREEEREEEAKEKEDKMEPFLDVTHDAH
ncbi:MAG: hypothetical protein Q8P67_14690 [archaeon]|nr:hypothetical protein [archaeon]